jgi:hypothetical protein
MKWSNKEQHDFLSGFANVFLTVGALLLVVYSVGPLFGGKFLPRALFVYGSWVLFALCLKLEAKCIKEKQIKSIKFITANSLELVCIAVWFSYPYNLFGVATFALLKIFGYKALAKKING